MARHAVVVTERALELLATRQGLHGAKSFLLWHLIQALPKGGGHLSLTDLSQTLGLSRVHTTNAMRTLLEAGFLLRGPKSGSLYHYQLNPAYFHLL